MCDRTTCTTATTTTTTATATTTRVGLTATQMQNSGNWIEPRECIFSNGAFSAVLRIARHLIRLEDKVKEK